MRHKFPLFPHIVEVTFSAIWANFLAYSQSDSEGKSIALYTSVLRSLYFIIINNFAITQLKNLWSRWRVKRFQGKVTKVKERVALIGHSRD